MRKFLVVFLVAVLFFCPSVTTAWYDGSETWGNGGRDEGLKRDLSGMATLVIAGGITYVLVRGVPRLFEKKDEMLERYKAILEVEKLRLNFKKEYGVDPPPLPQQFQPQPKTSFYYPERSFGVAPAGELLRRAGVSVPAVAVAPLTEEGAIILPPGSSEPVPVTEMFFTLEVGGVKKRFKLVPAE